MRKCQKSPIRMAKETYYSDKRGLMRLAVSKETYSYGKRDLFIWQKRPIHMAKETYSYGKRDLFIWQKRPNPTAKETYTRPAIGELNDIQPLQEFVLRRRVQHLQLLLLRWHKRIHGLAVQTALPRHLFYSQPPLPRPVKPRLPSAAPLFTHRLLPPVLGQVEIVVVDHLF